MFPGPWQEDVCFYIDVFTGEAFRVDKDTDSLTKEELETHWEEVLKADEKELRQFVQAKKFGNLDQNPEPQTSLMLYG